MAILIFICAGVLFALAAGSFSGKADNCRTLWKRLGIGGGVLLAGIACLAAATAAFFLPQCRDLLLELCRQRNPLIETSEMFRREISDALIWSIFGGYAGFLFLLFLIAFNVRRTANSLAAAWIGIILTVALFYVSFMIVFHGIDVWIIFAGDFADTLPNGKTFLGTLGFQLVLVTLWTVYSLFGKRFGTKILAVQIGAYAGIVILIWLLGLAAARSMLEIQKSAAERRNIVPFQLEPELPPPAAALFAQVDAFRKKHPRFELPFETTFEWKIGVPGGDPLPDDCRKYTLKMFDSEAMRSLCDTQEQLLKFSESRTELYLPILNSVRSYARIRAGRAALFQETNQLEKILPELMKITMIDRETLKDSPFIISELIRIACRAIWYSEMVKLGPDAPEYAPVYREALDFMKSRRIHLPDEVGYHLGCAQKIPSGTLGQFMARPSVYARIAKGLSHTLALKPELERLEKCEVFLNSSSDYERQALKGRTSLVMGTTVLALKCYRVEHGVYPERLEQLVPNYLDRVFVDPVTGNALNYQSDGKRFQIQPPKGQKSRAFSFSSEAEF